MADTDALLRNVEPDPTTPIDDTAGIVAGLWRAAPPGADFGDRAHLLASLATRLRQVADAARQRSGVAPVQDRSALHLLADTADVLRGALMVPDAATWQPPPQPELPWPARLRLARMERWLAERSEQDPSAAAAADLCLWLAEHIEAAQH
jgi:hypothetical protein